MDGIEATHEILDYEEDEEIPHVPIVALTANALKGDRERFLGEGMDEYITKPIETAELLYILNKFLSDSSNIVLIDNKKAVTKETDVIEETVIPVDNSTQDLELQKDDSLTLEKSIPLDMIDTSEIEIEQSNLATVTTKKLLIAKKFLLERRVLIKVIENLGLSYESIDDMDSLSSKLSSGDYDIVFTDNDLITDDISHISKNLDIITSRKSKDEIETLIRVKRG